MLKQLFLIAAVVLLWVGPAQSVATKEASTLFESDGTETCFFHEADWFWSDDSLIHELTTCNCYAAHSAGEYIVEWTGLNVGIVRVMAITEGCGSDDTCASCSGLISTDRYTIASTLGSDGTLDGVVSSPDFVKQSIEWGDTEYDLMRCVAPGAGWVTIIP